MGQDRRSRPHSTHRAQLSSARTREDEMRWPIMTFSHAQMPDRMRWNSKDLDLWDYTQLSTLNHNNLKLRALHLNTEIEGTELEAVRCRATPNPAAALLRHTLRPGCEPPCAGPPPCRPLLCCRSSPRAFGPRAPRTRWPGCWRCSARCGTSWVAGRPPSICLAPCRSGAMGWAWFCRVVLEPGWLWVGRATATLALT